HAAPVRAARRDDPGALLAADLGVVRRPAVKVQTLRTAEAFDEIASEWDALVEAMPRPSPFMLHGWLRAQWALCDAPRVVVVRRVGRLAAALPLDIRRRGRVRVAELIGGMDAHLGDALGDVTLVRTLLDEAARSCFDYADFFGMPAGSRLGSVPGFRLIER